jgi:hypothetical protein
VSYEGFVCWINSRFRMSNKDHASRVDEPRGMGTRFLAEKPQPRARWLRIGRWSLVAVVCVGVYLVLSDPLTCAYAGLPEVDLLKQFVQSTPTIEELLCKYTQLDVGTTHYYRLRWQSNACYLQYEDSLSDLTRPRLTGVSVAMSYFGDDKWMVAKNVVVHPRAGGTNSSAWIAGIKMTASDILNFGVATVEPSTIVWQGNHFVASTLDHRPVHGELSLSADGRPAKLDVDHEYRGTNYHYAVRYSWNTNLDCPYLPNLIRRYYPSRNGESLVLEVEIFSLKTSPMPLPRHQFELEAVGPPARIHLSEASRGPSLKGGQLPDLTPMGLGGDVCPAGKPVLLCLFDLEQRSSRRLLKQLAQQRDYLQQKGLTVLGVQALVTSADSFKQWKQANPMPFPVGRVAEKGEETKWATEAETLPWLILADRTHRVTDEGFSLGELEARLKEVSR